MNGGLFQKGTFQKGVFQLHSTTPPAPKLYRRYRNYGAMVLSGDKKPRRGR